MHLHGIESALVITLDCRRGVRRVQLEHQESKYAGQGCGIGEVDLSQFLVLALGTYFGTVLRQSFTGDSAAGLRNKVTSEEAKSGNGGTCARRP